MELQKTFIKESGVLYRLWTEDGRTFKCVIVPKVLQESMIILAHDHSDIMDQEEQLPKKTILLARHPETGIQAL